MWKTFQVGSYYLHFHMMDWIAVYKMSKAWNIVFLTQPVCKPNRSVTCRLCPLVLVNVVCSLINLWGLHHRAGSILRIFREIWRQNINSHNPFQIFVGLKKRFQWKELFLQCTANVGFHHCILPSYLFNQLICYLNLKLKHVNSSYLFECCRMQWSSHGLPFISDKRNKREI